MTPLLSLSGVPAFYGAIQALRGIDLTVNQGEIVTLIGANGAGKSTLMMTICGNPRARSGQIVHQGQDITHWPTHEIMRRGIAQVLDISLGAVSLSLSRSLARNGNCPHSAQ